MPILRADEHPIEVVGVAGLDEVIDVYGIDAHQGAAGVTDGQNYLGGSALCLCTFKHPVFTPEGDNLCGQRIVTCPKTLSMR